MDEGVFSEIWVLDEDALIIDGRLPVLISSGARPLSWTSRATIRFRPTTSSNGTNRPPSTAGPASALDGPCRSRREPVHLVASRSWQEDAPIVRSTIFTLAGAVLLMFASLSYGFVSLTERRRSPLSGW